MENWRKAQIRFYLYIFLEVVFVIFFMVKVGFLSYFGEVFLSGILGLWLAGIGKFRIFIKNPYLISIETVRSKTSINLAGFFLILPGIISDICGTLILCATLVITIMDELDDIKIRREIKKSKK